MQGNQFMIANIHICQTVNSVLKVKYTYWLYWNETKIKCILLPQKNLKHTARYREENKVNVPNQMN